MNHSLSNALLVGGAPIVVGAVLFSYGLLTANRAWRSRRWPRVMGAVLKSTVAEVPTSHRFSKQFRPVIVYSYEVAGVPYSSERLGFGFNGVLGDGLFRSRTEAENWATRYRPGAPVLVAYDPQNNATAVLRPGINKGHVANLLLGLFFIALGCCCLWSLPA